MNEKLNLVNAEDCSPRIVFERDAGSTELLAISAAINVAKTMSTLAQYRGGPSGSNLRSSHTSVMHANERQAKTIECSRNSGQMRLPSLIRTLGILKTSDEHERHRCMRMRAGVAADEVNPMSLNGR